MYCGRGRGNSPKTNKPTKEMIARGNMVRSRAALYTPRGQAHCVRPNRPATQSCRELFLGN